MWSAILQPCTGQSRQSSSKGNDPMGNIRIDLANVITIALVGFVGVWLINKGLTMAGMQRFAA